MSIKIWVDDVRPQPEDYSRVLSTNDCISLIKFLRSQGAEIALLDLDHDAGDFAYDGGDYIHILDWLEAEGINIPIRIYSMNPVGCQNMRAIIQKNGWMEVK